MSGRQRLILYMLVVLTVLQTLYVGMLQGELNQTRDELIQTKKDLVEITHTLAKFEDTTAKFMSHTNGTFDSVLDILKQMASR